MNPFSLNIKGQLYTWHTPIVMGIINATPDSFYTQSQYNSLQERIDTIGSMVTDGATIIDLGAASTQPGASIINSNEEVDRLMPVLEKAVSLFPNILFSIDTYHATVARQAVEAGAHIINDISAGAIDEDMLATVADLNVPYIIMHMQGTPHTMQQNPNYSNVVLEVMGYLQTRARACLNVGIKDVILDLGFGFGKTIAHNYQLLKYLHLYQTQPYPVLVGLSRKSMVYKLLDGTPETALAGSIALHTIALQQQAAILRVHDVKAAIDTIKVLSYYQTL